YTSGHSVQSGAAAAVLAAQFGSVGFVDHTHDARGLAPRSFPSFEEAAEEAHHHPHHHPHHHVQFKALVVIKQEM
ncbi:MAG: hypothetical protein AAB975_04090, partial [Patescibacteria group bacterium]